MHIEINVNRGYFIVTVDRAGSPAVWCEALCHAIAFSGVAAGAFDCPKVRFTRDGYEVRGELVHAHYHERTQVALAIRSARAMVRRAKAVRGQANMVMLRVA